MLPSEVVSQFQPVTATTSYEKLYASRVPTKFQKLNSLTV